MHVVVQEVASRALHDIRRRVLRDNDPSINVADPRDEAPKVIHLAASMDGRVVGSGSFYPSESPLHDGSVTYQLRYLAVDESLQRSGVGSALMAKAEEILLRRGVETLWANGRDTALDFYRQTGWIIVPDSAHLSPETNLPHHRIIKRLSA